MDGSYKVRLKKRQLEALRKTRSGFSNFVFPLIRHLAPQGLIEQLVQIQPMQAPPGLMFYLDFTYGRDMAVTWDPVEVETVQEAAMKILCGISAKVVDRRINVNENALRERQVYPAQAPAR